jgi:CBS domain-containing protein
MTTTQKIMTPTPVTCGQDEPMSAAAQRMWEHDVGALPVTDADGRAVAMITDRDVAMAAFTQGRPLREIRVAIAMSSKLWSAQPRMPLEEVERLMQHYQVRRIPVVDEDGRPIGIVTMNDLARRANTAGGPTAAEVTATLKAICRPRPGERVARAG